MQERWQQCGSDGSGCTAAGDLPCIPKGKLLLGRLAIGITYKFLIL